MILSSGVKSPFSPACFCHSPRPSYNEVFKENTFPNFKIVISRRVALVQMSPQLLEASLQQQTPATTS